MKFLYTILILVGIVTTSIAVTAFVQQKPYYSIDAQLGKLLFFDKRLSINKTKSCGSCHIPKLAFTDGVLKPLGALKDTVPRNTPTIINMHENSVFNWADESITSLQLQSNIPLFGKHPIEMGNDSLDNSTLQFIVNDSAYLPLIQQKNITTIDWKIVKDCIAAYVKTFVFQNSKYDKVLKGKAKFTADELAGKKLFFSEKLNCKKCHGGTNFNEPEFEQMNLYQNVGLYNVGKNHWYANNDNGLFNTSKDTDDIGKFKIPSLRNIVITAPYFHDGSAATLSEVITHYANGGRVITKGKNKGNGKNHPIKNQFVQGFSITKKETEQLQKFLATLTDTSYLKNEFYQNPFGE